MKLKTIDGKELKVKEDGFGLVYKGEEIKRDESIYGDQYVKLVEKKLGCHLKACINCGNLEHTPLSIDSTSAFKGLCRHRFKESENARNAKVKPENYDEMVFYKYSIVPIFFLCDHFKFEAHKEEKRVKVIRMVNDVLSKRIND